MSVTSGRDFDLGETIPISIEVINSGNLTLTNIEIESGATGAS